MATKKKLALHTVRTLTQKDAVNTLRKVRSTARELAKLLTTGDIDEEMIEDAVSLAWRIQTLATKGAAYCSMSPDARCRLAAKEGQP